MTLYTKKQSQEKKKDLNTLSLRRFNNKKRYLPINKHRELSILNRDYDNGVFLLQQMSLRKGKKGNAEKRAERIISTLKKRFPNRDPHRLLTDLLLKYRTLIFLKSKKLGSVTYKIPVNLFKQKGMRVMARWLMYKEKKKEKLKDIELPHEQVISLYNREGAAYKKRLELHKLGYTGIPYLTYLKRERAK